MGSNSTIIWSEIERSERYLLSCKFEMAACLASSVLNKTTTTTTCTTSQDLADMMESAGMVFIQSLRELGRTSEILKELKNLYGSVTAIPVEVLVTGACFQISDGCYSSLSDFLDEYLGKWRYVDGQFYILVDAEQSEDSLEGYTGHSILAIDKYLEVVEVYAVSLLGGILNSTDNAIAWVEKAELPEEKRQELLRRLRSLFSLKATNSSQNRDTSLLSHRNRADSEMDSSVSGVGETSRLPKDRSPPNVRDSRKQTILKFNEKAEPCFWWFRTVSLKFGSARLLLSHAKVALWGSFIIFICFILKKKRASLKQIATRQAISVKKALLDLWQLAFSVQVNPLAAVESLPSVARGNRG